MEASSAADRSGVGEEDDLCLPSSLAYRVGTWIPERRVHFVRALYAEGLADPANHPDIPPTP